MVADFKTYTELQDFMKLIAQAHNQTDPQKIDTEVVEILKRVALNNDRIKKIIFPDDENIGKENRKDNKTESDTAGKAEEVVREGQKEEQKNRDTNQTLKWMGTEERKDFETLQKKINSFLVDYITKSLRTEQVGVHDLIERTTYLEAILSKTLDAHSKKDEKARDELQKQLGATTYKDIYRNVQTLFEGWRAYILSDLENSELIEQKFTNEKITQIFKYVGRDEFTLEGLARLIAHFSLKEPRNDKEIKRITKDSLNDANDRLKQGISINAIIYTSRNPPRFQFNPNLFPHRAQPITPLSMKQTGNPS